MSEAPPAPTTQPVRPGQALAAARAELNLSVADVSRQIKYGVKQIAAIEADDYAKLPGTTFVRGMIRSYAKLVQIDAGPLLADLGRHDSPAPVTVDLHISGKEPFIEGGQKSNRIYVLLSVAALVAVVAVAYEWWMNPLDTGVVVTITQKAAPGNASETEPAPAPAPTPTPTPVPVPAAPAPAIAPPAPVSVPEPARGDAAGAAEEGIQSAGPTSAADARDSGLNRIELEFDELSWVEIKQSNGKVLLSQLNQAGAGQVVEGVAPFQVVIGNASKVRLRYNDKQVDLQPYFKVNVARLTLE